MQFLYKEVQSTVEGYSEKPQYKVFFFLNVEASLNIQLFKSYDYELPKHILHVSLANFSLTVMLSLFLREQKDFSLQTFHGS